MDFSRIFSWEIVHYSKFATITLISSVLSVFMLFKCASGAAYLVLSTLMHR